MIVSSPIPRAKQPKWHESSPLQGPRENDSTVRLWLRQKTNGYNSEGVYRELSIIKNQLGRFRRRVVGGGGSSSAGLVFKGEYNGGAYATQNMVLFTPDGQSAGTYIALKAVPAGTPPDTGYPFWVALPAPSPGVWS